MLLFVLRRLLFTIPTLFIISVVSFILIQLPPDLEVDLTALEATLDAFPAGLRLAVEPRHPSWFTEDLRQTLTDRGVGLCVADRRGPITPIWRTTDWMYLRFHEGRATPRSCYERRELEAWAERLKTAWGRAAAGFVYFNNDGSGCALRDASVFAHVLERRGESVAKLPVVSDAVLRDPTRPALPL